MEKGHRTINPFRGSVDTKKSKMNKGSSILSSLVGHLEKELLTSERSETHINEICFRCKIGSRSMFCKKCKSLLGRKDGRMYCSKCDSFQDDVKAEKIEMKKKEKTEKEILDDEQTLPTTKIECPKCHHDTASWIIRQTRAADEPPTMIYRCVKCKHSWREY